MGRLKRRNKHKKRPSKRNRKAHESDPERPGTETRENSPTTAWSCDEQALADYAHNAHVASDGSDEMEVTKRLSSLNFEVIPCALDPANFSCSHQRELGHLHHYQQLQEASCSHHAVSGVASVSEVELYTSATNLDVLPGIGEQESHLNSRQGRKRASRRKPNKKAKKMKSSYSSCFTACTRDRHTRKVKRSSLSQLRYNPMFTTQGRHLHHHLAHSPATAIPTVFVLKKMEMDDDSMSCLFSDTSAVCDVEMIQDGSGGPDTFDCAPPVDPSDSGYPSHHDMDAELFGAESDLSDSSTTDSGCEGDDEESSVEGPSQLQLPGWWDKEPAFSSTDEEEEKFSHILNGSFPLMSEEGRRTFKDQLSLPEFKHPGKFGIRGSVRKKKRKPTQTSTSLTPKEMDRRIAAFVQSSETVAELSFQFVSRVACRTIASLAAAYNLECMVEQKRRLPVASPVLRRTVLTAMATRSEVEQILKNHGRDSPTVLFKNACTVAMQQEPEPILAVGGKAPPLDDNNCGNRMLQSMGWKPGTGLGPQATGIRDPISAYIRPRHMGLGY